MTTTTRTISESTKEKALDSLDGMRQIVRAEMLIQGEYVDDEISNPRRIKSICGGRKHCAIGSLWAGGGVRPVFRGEMIVMPGVLSFERPTFLRSRHGLRVAYDALNAAARKFADDHGIDLDKDRSHDAEIEELFEGYWEYRIGKRDMLTIIADAKRRVRKL